MLGRAKRVHSCVLTATRTRPPCAPGVLLQTYLLSPSLFLCAGNHTGQVVGKRRRIYRLALIYVRPICEEPAGTPGRLGGWDPPAALSKHWNQRVGRCRGHMVRGRHTCLGVFGGRPAGSSDAPRRAGRMRLPRTP